MAINFNICREKFLSSIAVLFFIFYSSIGVLFSQEPGFAWVTYYGDSVNGYCAVGHSSIATDRWGNTYSLGGFSGVVDFDPGPAVDTSATGSLGAAHIVKFDSNGNFVWVRRFGIGTGFARVEQSHCIAVDTFGNVYSTGFFYGSDCDFDPGPGVYLLPYSIGDVDIFVTKFDSSGSFIWAKKLGGNERDYPICLNLDRDANVFISGSYSGLADFDPSPITSVMSIRYCRIKSFEFYPCILVSKPPVNCGFFIIPIRLPGSYFSFHRFHFINSSVQALAH